MPGKIINALIREMKSTYAGSPWYGDSMLKILQDTDPAIVFNRPVPAAHHIAEILSHVIAWRELLNKRLRGDESYSVKQRESFDWKKTDPNPETVWNHLLQALESNQQQIIQSLTLADDDILKKKVAGRSYTFNKLIRNILLHDVYHLGQIALLKKRL